jgi:hypothetical protein
MNEAVLEKMKDAIAQNAIMNVVCRLTNLLREQGLVDPGELEILADSMIASFERNVSTPDELRTDYAKHINFMLRGDARRFPDLRVIQGGKD